MRRTLLFFLMALCAITAVFAEVPAEDDNVGINALIILGEPEGPPLTGDALDQLTEEVASAIRCPQCQGLSIADSSANTAVAMKAELKDLLAAGYSREQAFTYFEKSYGEFIRLAPKAEGFNLMVWIAPIAGLLFGIVLIALRLRGSASTVAPAQAVDTTDDSTADKAASTDKAAPTDNAAPAENAVVDELAAYRARVRREVGP